MKPNQQAVFSTTPTTSRWWKLIFLTRPYSVKPHSSFEQEELYNVIKSLERWYGVRIHTEKEVSMNCQLTARIDRESLK